MPPVAGELGALRLPVAAPTKPNPFPDPALDVLGGYLRAYLTSYLGTAWLAIRPGEAIVRAAYTHDPQEHDFSSGILPALYLFREGSARDPVQVTEDHRVHADRVRIFWVCPPANQFQAAELSRALPAIAKTLDKALDEGRDPSWVLSGDPDPTAVVYGSVVLRHAGLRSMTAGSWRRTQLAIKKPGDHRENPELDLYPALDCQVVIEEDARQLFDVEVDGSALAGPADLVATIQRPDGTPIVEGRFLTGYAMLYFQGGSTAQSIGTSPAKLTSWTGSGPKQGVQPDAADGTLTVAENGVFMVGASLSVSGTSGRVVTARLRKNDVVVDGAGSSATLGSGRSVLAFVPVPVSCEAGDVLSLYAEADATDAAFTPIDGVLSASRS